MTDDDTMVATELGDEIGVSSTIQGSARDDQAPPAAGERVGRYLVLGHLGRGGMGTVLKAYDESLDRTVALKLMHGGLAEHHAARLTREAKALAKLSHPNVVQVYEVGQVAGRWFISMELVGGQTLRTWHDEPHDWSERVRVYLEAGTGLAAAHAQGLVHRDFKPDNCIIDEQGRPRVLDFGLVRAVDDPVEQAPTDKSPLEDEDIDVSRTKTGAVLGTVAYMPLEQLSGEPVDARSDQFSFCVSLYEALYGERPFPDDSMGRLAAALMDGDLRPTPRGSRVPMRVRRVVLRGLAKDPDLRWPSMDALLDALRSAADWRRRVGGRAAVAGAVAAALGVGVWSGRRVEEPPCQGASAHLDGVWDDERRAAMEAGIRGTSLSYAAETWERVGPRLDDYAAAWVDAHQDACEDANVRREHSLDMMDRRMMCLRARLDSLEAVVDVLTEPEPAQVQEAVALVEVLPSLSRCADVEALGVESPPPEDPQVAERVRALLKQRERAATLAESGRHEEALRMLGPVIEEAEALGYEPALAGAIYTRGFSFSLGGKYEEARRDYERVYVLATELGHHELAARAAIELMLVVGSRQAKREAGEQWSITALALARSPNVEAELEARAHNNLGAVYLEFGEFPEALEHVEAATEIWARTDGPKSVRMAQALSNMGGVRQKQGELAEALEHHQRALAIRRELLGPGHPHVAESLNNIGTVLHRLDRSEEALEFHRQALAIKTEARGPDHPSVGFSLANLGNVLKAQGRLDEAAQHYQRAVSVWERSLGEDHPNVAAAYNNIGTIQSRRGELDGALASFRRALASLERTRGPDHPHVAAARHNIGDILQRQGDVEGSLEERLRALAIRERAMGPDHPSVADSVVAIGATRLALGELQVARELYERGLRIHEEAFGPDHPKVAGALLGLAWVALAESSPGTARVHAERALAIGLESESMGESLPEIRFVLASALWSDPQQRARALELAREARDGYAELDDDERRRELRAWLRDHRTDAGDDGREP